MKRDRPPVGAVPVTGEVGVMSKSEGSSSVTDYAGRVRPGPQISLARPRVAERSFSCRRGDRRGRTCCAGW